MSKLSMLLIALLVAATHAFAPISQVRPQPAFVAAKESNTFALNMADSYWEGEYPPSSVLGPIMSKMPSGALGMISLVFLAACATSLAGSAELVREPGAFESGAWVKWYYVAGSFCGPLSWGTHVACWIQRKNGM